MKFSIKDLFSKKLHYLCSELSYYRFKEKKGSDGEL